MSESMKAGLTGGFIAGCILMSLVAACRIPQVHDEGIEQGKKIGLCEAKGGRMVEGVCAKVEAIK